MVLQCLCIGHGSLLKITSTRAAFARPGPARQAVPRRLCSYAALRLPAPISHGSGSPCGGLPRCGRLFCAHRPTTRAPATCRASETGHRLSAKPGLVEERRGPPRLRDRPLRTCSGRTPRRIQPPPCPKTPHAEGCCCLRWNPALSASGKSIGFGAAVPRPARSHAYASQNLFPRTAQGLLPARAGSPLAGQDSHLLDDKRSFMVASHPPIPFDPQGLVALELLSVEAYHFPCRCVISQVLGSPGVRLPPRICTLPTPCSRRCPCRICSPASSRQPSPWVLYPQPLKRLNDLKRG